MYYGKTNCKISCHFCSGADSFEYYLTDRVANFSYAIKYAEEELREAKTYPIIIIAIENDGFSETALPKKRTNISKN